MARVIRGKNITQTFYTDAEAARYSREFDKGTVPVLRLGVAMDGEEKLVVGYVRLRARDPLRTYIEKAPRTHGGVSSLWKWKAEPSRDLWHLRVDIKTHWEDGTPIEFSLRFDLRADYHALVDLAETGVLYLTTRSVQPGDEVSDVLGFGIGKELLQEFLTMYAFASTYIAV